MIYIILRLLLFNSAEIMILSQRETMIPISTMWDLCKVIFDAYRQSPRSRNTLTFTLLKSAVSHHRWQQDLNLTRQKRWHGTLHLKALWGRKLPVSSLSRWETRFPSTHPDGVLSLSTESPENWWPSSGVSRLIASHVTGKYFSPAKTLWKWSIECMSFAGRILMSCKWNAY